MLPRHHLSDLALFQLIVQHRSFRRAADQLGLTASALSHRMKALETQLGLRLLHRTSRSVAPTAAGALLAEKVAAGLDLIETGLADLHLRHGTLRLNVLRDAVPLLLAPALPIFRARHPEFELEIAVDDQFVDVVAEGFDAGLRYQGTIDQDMIALPVTGPLRWIAVAAPAYVAARGAPGTPPDLLAHDCIRIRTGRRQIYRWELDDGAIFHELDVPGPLTSGATDLSLSSALAGLGIAYVLEPLALPLIAEGRLQRVLPGWSSTGAPLAFYTPSRRQMPPALSALIAILREIRPTG